MSKPQISIIVPCHSTNQYITQNLIPALTNQSVSNFELILIPSIKEGVEKLPSFPRIFIKDTTPGEKRNFAVSRSKADIIAFIDDDAYPSPDWLQNILKVFSQPQFCSTQDLAAICGPGLTPSTNDFLQQVSGFVWSTWIGAGGAGTYRAIPKPPRLVDDYPSFNLIVKKKDFQSVSGFHPSYWPGEDTKLCLDLTKSGKKILYHPDIVVYHHRRAVFTSHLQQISRYGLHRGYFFKIHPHTSRKINYLPPVIWTSFLTLALPMYLIFSWTNNPLSPTIGFIFLFPILIYALTLVIYGLQISTSKRNLKYLLYFPISIFLTHLVYGLQFIRGLFTPRLYPPHSQPSPKL